MALSVLDIIADAFTELGVRGAADTLSAEDGELGLARLNMLLDAWNADRQTVYRVTFATFAITPNLQPHTIGPTAATWTTTARPEEIESAMLVLNTSTPDVNVPLNIRTADWWGALSVPALTSTVPTDLYYDPAFINGNVYLWPVPTTAYDVQLQLRLLLDSDLALADSFSMPPGYRKALMLTLAEDLAAPMNTPVKPSTVEAARKARAQLFANNTAIPPLRTQDSGMPRSRGAGVRGDFNWLSGQVTR